MKYSHRVLKKIMKFIRHRKVLIICEKIYMHHLLSRYI